MYIATAVRPWSCQSCLPQFLLQEPWPCFQAHTVRRTSWIAACPQLWSTVGRNLLPLWPLRCHSCCVQVVVFFELWRWLFFFAGLIAAYYVAYYCMQVVVVMIESQFFTFRQVLYYVIGIRVSSTVTMTSSGM